MQFSPEITIGNIITAVTLVVGGVVAWVKMMGAVDENERRIRDLESSQGELERKQSTVESILSGVKADIGWIRETMERIQDREDRKGN